VVSFYALLYVNPLYIAFCKCSLIINNETQGRRSVMSCLCLCRLLLRGAQRQGTAQTFQPSIFKKSSYTQIRDDASKLQCALHIPVQDGLELQALHTYSGTCFREAQSMICSCSISWGGIVSQLAVHRHVRIIQPEVSSFTIAS